MPKRKDRVYLAEPMALGRVLRELAPELRMRGAFIFHQISSHWEELVGELNARHARPLTLRNGVLFVAASDSSWMMNLQFIKHRFLEELNRMLRYSFMLPEVEGFGASVRVANGCTIELHGITKVDMPQSFLGRIQAVEYLRAFYMGRMGFEFLGGPLIISGAFGIYRTSIVRREGGYDNTTLAEDMEMVLKYKKGRYLHPQQHRPITHREAARFQSFPDDFVFKGTKIEIAKQIGNAVPPLLAARIADVVYRLLSEK